MNDMSVEEWYSRQCNGEWEHGFGVEIATIDNPMVSQYRPARYLKTVRRIRAGENRPRTGRLDFTTGLKSRNFRFAVDH
jgi:Immunity protein 53